VFIQKTHEQLQKIFQYFFLKSKPLPLFSPSLRLKETQAKAASLLPPERLQEISWQDPWGGAKINGKNATGPQCGRRSLANGRTARPRR
jgi:hypothetical protein